MKFTRYSVLLIDDDLLNLEATQRLMKLWGYSVRTAACCDEAIVILKSSTEEFAAILVDYRMPDKDGAHTIREIREINQEAVIAMYSCDESKEAAVLSQRAGAVDFIDKDDTEYLKASIERACIKFEEGRTLRPHTPSDEAEQIIASEGMVGCSQALAEVARQIKMFRLSTATLLITGESGAGKELVARALHNGKGQFVTINCASFGKDSNLLESELFGHEKGAFTGAVVRKVGLLETARGGTVFLDEIHHMSLASQAQLLRAVDEKKIRRLGGNEEYPIDFRLIVATKADIEERVKKGAFLEDLYFRVRFLRIKVPSLRERPEDIPPLVAHFCRKHLEETGQKKTFLMRTVKVLQKHDWPGNIRDLQGYVKNLLTQCPSDTIDTKHLDLQFFEANPLQSPARSYPELESRQEQERRAFVLSALRETKTAAKAAQRIGLPATTLRSMLGRLGISMNR